MSYKTLALIIALIIVTAGLVYLAASPSQPSKIAKNLSTITPMPTPALYALLSFSPNPVLISSNSATADVILDTQSGKTSGVQLELSYDPKVISNLAVSQGPFLAKATILPFTTASPTQGLQTFALGLTPTSSSSGQMGKGIVARISFKTALPAGQKTQIHLLPQSIVVAAGFSKSVLKSADNLTVMMQQASDAAAMMHPTTTSTSTTSGTKAGY